MTDLLPQTDYATDPAALLERLENVLRSYPRLLIAYSGGVDSGVLLGAAVRVLGDKAIAITADSPSMARRELREAKIFARSIGADHRVIETNELDRPEYAKNDRDRCFWCKATLFERCRALGEELGIEQIAYGFNLDDRGDIRPGQKAAEEYGVVAPLDEARLGKAEVRAIARHLGYELWDKPAAPCLSSRIPYGSEVTDVKLATIESMEDLMHDLGFRIFRARYDGKMMRLEFADDEIGHAVQSEVRTQLLSRAGELGVPLLTIDLEGFKSGKLNRVAG
jgi:uncharacterized protein